MITSDTPLDVDLIKECLEELQPLEDKNTFMYGLTQKRLDIYNKDYLEKFNNTVDRLYNHAVNGNIKSMGIYLNRLAKISLGLSKLELSIYKSLLKGGKKNDNK